MWVTIISDYYKLGLYTADDIKLFATAGWIKDADYKTITGINYTM